MRKALVLGALIALSLIVGSGVWLYFYVQDLVPRTRERIVQALQDRFDADIELNSLNLSVYPLPTVVGEALSIRHKGWTDPHPLIYIRKFTARTDFSSIFERRNHVDLLRLDGLEIHIPPRGPSTGGNARKDTTRLRFLIEGIVADNVLLEIEPKKEGKQPLRFAIEKMTLHSAGPAQAMRFESVLTNAQPPGRITTSGQFGPWQRDDPRATQVSGSYTFQNANLVVFKGISGILSSIGNYHGVLQQINIDGTTDTPRFALKRGGEPVHLRTRFRAVVDGINGDTVLDSVNAHFLQTEFICRGGVIRDTHATAKTLSLSATTTRARMEDILRLVLGKDKPFLKGAVDFRSKIILPPGPEDVLDKLQLDGQFAISAAEFTSPDVERRLGTLSDRALGISKKEEQQLPPDTVASDFQGRFKLDRGITSFSRLSFQVPGAQITLNGNYDLRSGQIDMAGQFRMLATLSETQSGIKHWVFKPFNRLFEKNGAGFEVPIKITGTREHPEIGTEIFHRHITIH